MGEPVGDARVRRGFLCDEMLGRLARYLRAGGHDTLLARAGIADRAWLALACREDRWFLTCDRRIDQHNAAKGVAVILPHADLPGAAAVATARCGIDWLHAPFTRCLVDNTRLAHMPDALDRQVPADVAPALARWCPDCGRTYWTGSHFWRMHEQLTLWAAGQFVSGEG